MYLSRDPALTERLLQKAKRAKVKKEDEDNQRASWLNHGARHRHPAS